MNTTRIMAGFVVRSILEPQFEIVGSVYDGQALIEATAKLRPNLIVTDLAMPVLNGLEAARKLRKSGSIAPIVFLTRHEPGVFRS